MTRVTMGPWLGFLTAMLEIAQSLLSFVLGVWYLSDLISNQASGGGDLKLMVSIPLLFGFCMFNIWMQKETPSTWVWILVGAGTVLFLWLVFFVGAATNLDFNTFALEPLNQEKGQQEHSIVNVSDSICVAVWSFSLFNAIPSIAPRILTVGSAVVCFSSLC